MHLIYSHSKNSLLMQIYKNLITIIVWLAQLYPVVFCSVFREAKERGHRIGWHIRRMRKQATTAANMPGDETTTTKTHQNNEKKNTEKNVSSHQ